MKINLNLAIFLVLAAVVTILSAVLGMLSYQEHRATVNALTKDLFIEQQRTITTVLQSKFSVQSRLGKMAADAIPNLYSKGNPKKIEQYLLSHLKYFDEIEAIFFSDINNEFSGFIYQNQYLHMFSNAQTDYTIHFAKVDENFQDIEVIDSVPGFLATSRPWYQSALNKKSVGFSDIFTYHAYSTLALPHSLPVYNENKELLGVFGSNIFLGEFGGFLKEQVNATNGIAVILDEDNKVVASSLEVSPIMQFETRSELVDAAESANPYIRESVYTLPVEKKNSEKEQGLQLITVNNQKYLAGTFYFDHIPNLNWKISLFFPENEFHQDVTKFITKLGLLISGILALSLFMSLWLSRLISKPISSMVDRFSDIDRSFFEHSDIAPAAIKLQEVSTLKSAANEYKYWIRDTLTSLQTKVRENKEQLSQIQQLALVSQSMDDMSIILSPKGIVDWVNQPFLNFFGLAKSTVENKSLASITTNEKTKSILLAKIAAQCDISFNDKEFKSANIAVKSIMRFELRFYPVLGVEYEDKILVMIRDISAQKLNEEALTIWKQIFDATTIGIAISYKNDQAIQQVNQAFAKIYGGEVEEFVGSDISSFYPPDAKETSDRLRTLVNERGDLTIETEQVRKTGEIFPALLSVSFVRDSLGEVLARIALITDLTEIKQMQQQLFQSQKLHAIGSLTGGIVHDMNNILGAITGNAEIGELINQAEQDQNAQKSLKYFKGILKAASRGTKLTQQILAFTRMETMEMRPVNVTRLVDDTVEIIAATKPKNVNIIVKNAVSADRVVLGNESQLQQVILNLMSNAIKAIVKQNRTDGELSISLSEENEKVIIVVRDNGCGMKKSVLDNVFEPFFTTEVKGKGTGLGLSIVKRIVEAHKGAISVTSEQQVGTRFELQLDVLATGSEQLTNLPNVEMDNVFKPHVVMVDDDQDLLIVWKELFATRDIDILTFHDPLKAKEYCLTHLDEIDCLVSDFDMPELNGEELILSIRDQSKALGIIMLTGFSERINQVTADALSLNKLMFKPVVFEELLNAVLTVCKTKNVKERVGQ